MKEIQQLRKTVVKLESSGTAIPIAETRLYKGGYGFAVLQCCVPVTQNRSPTTSPLCTVFRTAVDKFGNRKQFNKDIYNMLYVSDAVIENANYMVFECPLPKAFTDTVGELEMVFTYSEVNTENKAVVRLASGIYKTSVGDSDVSDGETIDPLGGELARLNDMTVKVEQLEDSVEALLQSPDCSDADKVGTPNVSLTEDGRLKFSELKGEKGEKGDTGEAVDSKARYDVTAETARAEAAESEIQSNLDTAQEQLQGQISVNTSDIQGLREDIANESHFRGMYNGVEDLRAAYPTATPNDYAWIAGGNIWIYTDGAWTDSGNPVPSTSVPKGTATPLMDGTASAGTSTAYSSEDHRHPSDTTKANTSGTYPNLTVGAATKAANDGNGNSIITTYVKHTFNETSSSPTARIVQHYIGQEINMTIPAFRETAFVFTNCWGSVNVSDNNVKVYIVNSPYLTVRGKDAQNWQNIYVDGLAAYSYKDSLTIPGGYTAPIFETEFKEGDEIQISGIAGENPVNFSFRLTTVRSEQFYNIVYLTPGFYYGRASVYLERNFLVIKDVKEWYIGSGSPYEQQFTLRSFTIRRHT